MKYINFENIDYDYENNIHLYKGEPFSGIAFEINSLKDLEETMIIGGLKNGYYRKWYPSGVLKTEVYLLNNIYHGLKWEWFESRNIKSEAIYEFGILMKECIWDDNGELLSKYQIDENTAQYNSLLILRNK
jgi:antitoxin component YwqK of YwqJK toxin-antitoxin module